MNRLNLSAACLPAACGQLLLCLSDDWASTSGWLYRFSRPAAGEAWQAVGMPCPVQLGRGGMGWGIGLHTAFASPALAAGPQKVEGDSRTPAGVFRIGEVFGVAPVETACAVTRLPYRQATPTLHYVDDPASRHYNQPVDSATLHTIPDWHTAEALLREDSRYDWVIVIGHNPATASHPAQAGGGSCIFFHLWQDAQTPTAGCSALCRQDMEQLLGWLDPALNPCVVQLPQIMYNDLQAGWQLPLITA